MAPQTWGGDQTCIHSGGILDYLGTSYSREILRPMVKKFRDLAQAHQDHAVSVATKLDIERRSLLDLSMQNPLLNYRLLRSRGVSIGRHTPHEILNALPKRSRPRSYCREKNLSKSLAVQSA
ncbi:MAG: hypothetical protein CM1200mP22_18050 [Dehalococcoidia bacterium]|nr:MAG: hypothetical protein CM1200mP22_18050 [Dehalococcoidia bacterium]